MIMLGQVCIRSLRAQLERDRDRAGEKIEMGNFGVLILILKSENFYGLVTLTLSLNILQWFSMYNYIKFNTKQQGNSSKES
jgi:hypothetical protein